MKIFCPICENQNLKTIIEKKIKLQKCLNCKLIFTHPQPQDNLINTIYNKDYFLNYLKLQKFKILEFKKRLKHLQYLFRERKKILDIGSETGIFLSLLQDKNEVYGLEISPYAVSIAKEKIKGEIICGSIENTNFPSDFFDIITLWHTLEHLRNPFYTLKEIYRILKGVLIIEIPNNNFLFKFPAGFGRPSPLEHLFQLNEFNLSKLLKKSGFKIVKKFFLKPTLYPGIKNFIQYFLSLTTYQLSKLIKINISDNIVVVCKKEVSNIL